MANGPSYKQLSGYSLVPAADTLQKTPTYVIITNTGSYAFSYPDRSNGQTTSSYMSGSTTTDHPAAGAFSNHMIKLDINPVMWRRTDAASVLGDVTFVYVRVR